MSSYALRLCLFFVSSILFSVEWTCKRRKVVKVSAVSGVIKKQRTTGGFVYVRGIRPTTQICGEYIPSGRRAVEQMVKINFDVKFFENNYNPIISQLFELRKPLVVVHETEVL